MNFFKRHHSRRRGAIILLTVFLLIFLLGIIAFSVDLGYIVLARTQLQAAADSASLAAAGTMGNEQTDSIATGIKYAAYNKVGGKNVVLKTSDFVYGTWDATTRIFTPSQSGLGNAVKVTARADDTTSGAIPLFFGGVFSKSTANCQASSVATANPRDICFVVDLSSSMNDDTDPANTSNIDANYAGAGTLMMQNLYTDLDYGTYPGTSQAIGAPLGKNSLSGLTSTSNSPLLNTRQPRTVTVNGHNYSYTVPAAYQFSKNDSSSVREQKAYSWVIDEQLGGKSGSAAMPGLMKNAKPALNSSANYSYWKEYVSENSSNLGYKSYVAAIEPKGRDVKPFSASSLLSPMSVNSADCPYHPEATAGGMFNFPPREMPTHSARRAMIGAIQIVKERNQNIANVNQRDWVAIVTYDVQASTTTVRNLSGDYNATMQACCNLQSCGSGSSCTATETGLAHAVSLLNSQGRVNTNKVVVLLTDGKPNLYSSSNSAISSYRNANSNSNFYGGSGSYPQDAAIMQASIIQSKNWTLFPVALGLQGDDSFMDRLYSVGKGKTSQTDNSPYATSGDPIAYEAQLREMFDQIISTPHVRIVQ